MKNILLIQVFFALLAIAFWGIIAFFLESVLLEDILFSSLFGGLAVIFPAGIFAYLIRYLGGSVIGIFACELTKVLLTVILLILFVGFYNTVNWLALLTSFILVIQAYWLALIKK